MCIGDSTIHDGEWDTAWEVGSGDTKVDLFTDSDDVTGSGLSTVTAISVEVNIEFEWTSTVSVSGCIDIGNNDIVALSV